MILQFHDSSPPFSDSLVHILQQPSNGTSWQEADTSAISLFLCYCAKSSYNRLLVKTAPLSNISSRDRGRFYVLLRHN